MLGAIIGDIIGSFYEWNNVKTIDFDLFPKEATFTDDTVMTLAVAKWLIEDKNHTDAGLVKTMQELGRKYPNAGYGGHFYDWIFSNNPLPYNSWGNGSAMRVSPVGLAANNIEDTLHLAEVSAAVTHNHPEGIKGAQAIAACVFYNRTLTGNLNERKQFIKDYVERSFGYNLSRSLDEIRPSYKFDVSCQGSVPEAIIAFLEAETLEECARKAVSLGGDSDTIAAMACSIFAAGVDCFSDTEPESWLIATKCQSYLDEYLLNINGEFEKALPFYVGKSWENEHHYANSRMEHGITQYYYIGFNYIQCGPVLRDQLVALGVTPETFVWKAGMTDWQQAKYVAELNIIWSNISYNSSCRICRLNDSAICKDCVDYSMFSLCDSISPNWRMRQTERTNSLHNNESYVPTFTPHGVLYGPRPVNVSLKEKFSQSFDTDMQPTVYGTPVNIANERFDSHHCVYGPPPLLQRIGWCAFLGLFAIMFFLLLVISLICKFSE